MIDVALAVPSALVFGSCATLAIAYAAKVCDTIVPFEDGPVPGIPPTRALVVGAALVGGILGSRGLPVVDLGIFAVLLVALAACWYSDVRCGIVPDVFTLGALAIVLAVEVASREFASLFAVAVVAFPFAIAAALSKGRGMGWGDVKLVALGAAVLGLNKSVFALATACIAAVAIATIRRRRTSPIAFAPYLAGSIAFAATLPVFP